MDNLMQNNDNINNIKDLQHLNPNESQSLYDNI